MEKNLKREDKKKDLILNVILIILIMIAVIFLIVRLIYGNNLKTDDKLVVELNNYFNSEELKNCEGLFNYSNKTVEYKDVDSEVKMCLAYQKAAKKDTEKETYAKDKKGNLCTHDEMVFRVDDNTKKCEITKIAKDEIDSVYKKIFGKDVEKIQSFKIDDQNICYIKDDAYYCGLSESFTYTFGSDSTIYRLVNKAIEKGSNIIIYDYFIKINNNICYQDYTTLTQNKACTGAYKINKDITYDFMSKYGTMYKHTYQKAEDNSYYWVKSEILN